MTKKEKSEQTKTRNQSQTQTKNKQTKHQNGNILSLASQSIIFVSLSVPQILAILRLLKIQRLLLFKVIFSL